MCTFSTAMLLSVLTLKELAVRAVLLEELPTGELPKTLKEEVDALSRLAGVRMYFEVSWTTFGKRLEVPKVVLFA